MVDIWEAWVTFAFFIVMLLSAYIVDRQPWTWKSWKVSSVGEREGARCERVVLSAARFLCTEPARAARARSHAAWLLRRVSRIMPCPHVMCV